MCVRLKELIIEQHPDLETIGRSKEAFVLEQAANEAWLSISNEYILELIESMLHRMAAVIEADGCYKKH